MTYIACDEQSGQAAGLVAWRNQDLQGSAAPLHINVIVEGVNQ
jgi:hypothetical protein